jgi:tetratricopeptide (TPR) repeat protein
MPKEDRFDLDVLRSRAETAIRRGKPADEIRPVLERMLSLAREGSDEALFAHRHLAELLIEEHPWRAALHLRAVSSLVDDDVVHALMGLCQALLGNFQSAVAAYRRALTRAPRNPWYHHNLGHLLDVALDRPDDAERHLRMAHRMEPHEHEITASLAHCLARRGEVDEARTLADEAVRAAPRSADHRALLKWIEAGANANREPRRVRRASTKPKADRAAAPKAGAQAREPAAGADSPRASRASIPSRGAVAPKGERAEPAEKDGKPLRDVERTLVRGMRDAGFPAEYLERARALWADFVDGRELRGLRVHKPESYAAAVEYAIACVSGIDGVTQADVARRYGIAPKTLKTRYFQIRDALSLEPNDPRYGHVQQ